MKRKYKILIIIIISILLTYFIYIFNHHKNLNIINIGDGISSGETAYNIDGISFGDYLKNYFESKKLLKNYNSNFSKKNYKINDLLTDITQNILDKKTSLYIDQLLHQSNLVIIAIGEDELSKLSITNDLDKNQIINYIKNYDKLLTKLKKITEAKIIIIGLYENIYLNKANIIIINSELANLSKKHNITFIDVSDLLLDKQYYLNKKSYYFSYKAHKTIAKMIINSI